MQHRHYLLASSDAGDEAVYVVAAGPLAGWATADTVANTRYEAHLMGHLDSEKSTVSAARRVL